MSKVIHYFFILSAIFLSAVFAQPVSAAVLYMLPETGNVKRGEQFSVDVRIDSEGKGINAAQATVTWPAGTLQFIGASREGSAFNFWIEEPKLSSSSDSLNFIGGTAKGISGEALQILKIKFEAKEAGVVSISMSDAAITASDGRGTDVLSKVQGASYRIGIEVVQPELPKFEPGASQEIPLVVERKALVAERLPLKPGLTVPLYADQVRWHNNLGELVVLWDVPDDVTAVVTALDHSPNTVPQNTEKELTTGKKFGILDEGVWYVHVRFRNSLGLGPVAHWRIGIDLTPPLAFEITLPEGEVTDNPAPVFQFRTSDELSGLKGYQIRVDEGEVKQISAADFQESFTLPLQTPGKHRIVVKAIDSAENSVEDDVLLDILPILSPVFTFVPMELFSDESRDLLVKGNTLPNVNVLLEVRRALKRGMSEVAVKSIATADEQGSWEFTFRESLKHGRYVVTAQSQDTRGALSLVVTSQEFQIKVKPIIQIGLFQLGMSGAALLLLFILIVSFGGGVWFYKKWQEKLAMRIVFTRSEITKIFQLIREDVERVSKAAETPTTGDDEYTMKRLQENIQKMEAYLKKGIEKIDNT